jgi:two-component system sensor histidine kinase UhpB
MNIKSRLNRFCHRLLLIPLAYKILWANVAIVALGAIVGTVVTVWHVTTYPEDIHYELIAVFALAGFAVSYIVNTWVLKRALEPLDRIQNAVDQVRQGNLETRVQLGANRDERFERLADTFNQMLAALQEDTRQLHRLSRLILQTQEEERQRVARDLHDEAAQALTSLLVHLRLTERSQTPEDIRQRVHELRELTAAALDEVRRIALDLRPKILDDLGLVTALEWRLDEFRTAHGIQVEFVVSGVTRRLPATQELVLYRVAQEALSNIAKHAQAGQVRVALEQQEDVVMLSVQDDGIGFSPTPTDDGGQGLGILGMRERLAMVGGTLSVESRPGAGTHVLARVPLAPGTALATPISAPSIPATLRTTVAAADAAGLAPAPTDDPDASRIPGGGAHVEDSHSVR